MAVLKAEMVADAGVFVAAVDAAAERLGGRTPVEVESCSYQLSRAYNVLVQIPDRPT